MNEQIGFIGLGVMGKPMSLRLLKAGYPMTASDIAPEQVKELTRAGAKPARSAKEVAACSEVVITMLPDSPDVEKVVCGDNGLLQGIRPGSLYIDMSTISPDVTKRLAGEVAAKGAEMLDAPVSGGQKGAIEGTLSIMVGGPKEAFDRARPLFEVLGKNIVHMGEIGQGQMTKLCNQVICGLTILAVAEGIMLGVRSGLNMEKMLKVVTAGLAGSNILSQVGPKMVSGDMEPGFMIDLQQKDLRLALDSAYELRLPLPGTALVKQLFCVAQAAGKGRKGTQALVEALAKMASLK